MADATTRRETAQYIGQVSRVGTNRYSSRYPVGRFTDSFPDRDALSRRWSVIDQMRLDPVISAALTIKKWLVVSDGIEIHPYDNSDVAKEHAEFVSSVLEQAKGTTEGLIADILDACAIGFSLVEKVFKVQDGGKYDGALVPDYFFPVDPSNVGFDIHETGGFDITLTSAGEYSAEPQPKEKFILYTYNGRYGSPWGQGDFLRVHRSWISKASAIKWWAVRTELTGIPARVGKYDDGASQELQNKIFEKIKTTAADQTFIVPKSAELEFWEPNGNGEGIEKFVAFHNKEIIQGILGSVLLMDEGQRVGSMALGRVQHDVTLAQIKKLKREIEEDALGSQLVRQLIDLNFPAGVMRVGGYPKVKLPMADPTTIVDRATAMGQAIRDGVVYSDEPWVREYMGYPAAAPEIDQRRQDDDAASKAAEERLV